MPIREPPYRRAWREQESAGPGARFPMPSASFAPRPIATYWLLGTIVVVFILQLAAAAVGGNELHRHYFVIDQDWLQRPWTLITSTLAHGSPTHLFFNGIFLYFLGPTVESLVGRKRIVALFFLTGGLAGVVQAHLSEYLAPGSPGALGASGALMAFFGMLVVITPKAKMFMWPLPVPIPMWVAGLAFVLLDLVGAFNPHSTIGNFAHLAGLGLGAAYGAHFKRNLRRRGLRVFQG